MSLKIEGADPQTERTLNAVEPAQIGDATHAPLERLVTGSKPDMDLARLESFAEAKRAASQELKRERAIIEKPTFRRESDYAALRPLNRKLAEAESRYQTAEVLAAITLQREPIMGALKTQLGILAGGSVTQEWVAKGKRWGVVLGVPHGEGVLHLAAWGHVSEAGLLETVNIGAAPVPDQRDGESEGDYTMRLVDGIWVRPMATLRQIQGHFSREVSWELDLRNGRADMASLDAFMAALRLIASWGKALEQAETPTDGYLIQEGRIKLLEMQGLDTSTAIQLDRFASRATPKIQD